MNQKDFILSGYETKLVDMQYISRSYTDFVFDISEIQNPEILLKQSILVILREEDELIEKHVGLLIKLSERPGRFYNVLVRVCSWFFPAVKSQDEHLLEIWGNLTKSTDQMENLTDEGLISLLMIVIYLNSVTIMDKIFSRDFLLTKFMGRDDIFGSSTDYVSGIISWLMEEIAELPRPTVEFETINETMIKFYGLIYFIEEKLFSDTGLLAYLRRLLNSYVEGDNEELIITFYLCNFYEIEGVSGKIRDLIKIQEEKILTPTYAKIIFVIVNLVFYFVTLSRVLDRDSNPLFEPITYLIAIHLVYISKIYNEGRIPKFSSVINKVQEEFPRFLT